MGPSDMRRRLILGGVLLAGAVTLFLLWFGRCTVWVRARVVLALNERFVSQVELGSLQLSLLPRHRAAGTSLTFPQNGRTDVPPLVTVGTFDASAGVIGLVGRPVHLREVNISSLDIYIPRRLRPLDSQPKDPDIEDLQARRAPPLGLPPHPTHQFASSSILRRTPILTSFSTSSTSSRQSRIRSQSSCSRWSMESRARFR